MFLLYSRKYVTFPQDDLNVFHEKHSTYVNIYLNISNVLAVVCFLKSLFSRNSSKCIENSRTVSIVHSYENFIYKTVHFLYPIIQTRNVKQLTSENKKVKHKLK